MKPALAAGLSLLLATGVSFAVSRIMVWCGPVDTPRGRGLHLEATPTSGGLGMLCGAAASLLLFKGLHPGARDVLPTAAALVLASALGLFGALDDLFDIDARLKLVAQLAVALVFAVFVAHPAALPLPFGSGEVALPPLVAIGGTTLWVVVVINTVNFMDGANGLVAGALAVVAGAMALAAIDAGHWPATGMALACLCAATLGFLPANFPRARVFMGDAGSHFLGGLLAMLAVVAAESVGRSASINLLAAPIALTPLLTDVFLTLIARARRRARLFEAHREHIYQRWFLANGERHGALAARVWVLTGLYSLAAFIVAVGGNALAWPLLILGVAASVGGWLWLDRRLGPR